MASMGERTLSVVKVILQSGAIIESPYKMAPGEAEEIVATIGKARDEGESVDLPWLTVGGLEVVAAHVEMRYPTSTSF